MRLTEDDRRSIEAAIREEENAAKSEAYKADIRRREEERRREREAQAKQDGPYGKAKEFFKIGQDSLSDYAKLPKNFPGGPKMIDVLKELPRHAEVRAVMLDVNQLGQKIKMAILVRVRGSRTSVVGLGIVEFAMGK